MQRFLKLTAAAQIAVLVPNSFYAEEFSIIALPDTQFYSRYSDVSQYLNFENPFNTQTQWIASNAVARNIKFVAHLGDVVDQADVASEWTFADSAMSTLDQAGVNYGVARGNHDITPQGADNTLSTPFTDYFGPDRFQSVNSYVGSDSAGVNSYHQFDAGGRTFGVLFTDWRNDTAELAWAQSVLDANPDVPTILISHQIIAPDANDPTAPNDTDQGTLLWNELITDNDQVFLTLNGHHQGQAWRTQQNTAGNDVLQMVVDYQFNAYNGTGYLSELVFDTDANTVSVSTFSPWVAAAEAEGITLPSFYNITEQIVTPQANFVYQIDFDQRFGVVPEPTSLSLIAMGGLVMLRRRR